MSSPEPGHEQFAGRLVIPYLDKLGVYAVKFRCTIHSDCKAEGCTKYLALAGQETGLYNVLDADTVDDTIHVTEGELDALVLKQVLGQAVVGVPGVHLWKPHHPFHFGGFARVLLWMDGDKEGQDLGNRIRKSVRNAEVVPVPRGMDVTEWFLQLEDAGSVFRQVIGEDEDE